LEPLGTVESTVIHLVCNFTEKKGLGPHA
jgi:hypothetical protein